MISILLVSFFVALYGILSAFCDMLMQMFNIAVFPDKWDPAINRFPWHFAKFLTLGVRSAAIIVAYLYGWHYSYYLLAIFASSWGLIHWVFFERTKYLLTKDKVNHYKLF